MKNGKLYEPYMNFKHHKFSKNFWKMISTYTCNKRRTNSSPIERFSIECCKTKTKPITYQLHYSANLKP